MRELAKEFADKLRKDLEPEGDLRQAFKRMISEWHTLKPQYVFLTETSATPWGYLIKSAWKQAYPNEECPRFYRIDPRALQNAWEPQKETALYEKWNNYFTSRIKDKNSQVIIFDETSEGSGGSTGTVWKALNWNLWRNYLVNQFETNVPFEPKGKKFAQEVKKDEKKYAIDLKNIHVYRGIGLQRQGRGGGNPLRAITYKSDERDIPISEVSLTAKHFPAKSIEAKKAQEYICELKLTGSDIGKEIREAKKKGLEGTIGIISIAGFLFSVLFFSGITGNVIGSLNQTSSNVIGAVLFLVGIAGAFLYFKRR